jgi:murein L,D-transpeptidase YafK
MKPATLFLVLLACPAAWSVCPEKGAALSVSTREHRLALCEGGRPVRSFPVALGSGGVGKTRQGDARTPLGLYPLGAPRPSEQFHTFIPVRYPTRAQRAHGRTGSAVGVHGPPRATRWAGLANTSADWTLGCIAVGSDQEIDEIAGWIRRRPGITIHIE